MMKFKMKSRLNIQQSTTAIALPTLRLSPQGLLRYLIHMSYVGIGVVAVYPMATYVQAAPTFGSPAWLSQASATAAKPPVLNSQQSNRPNIPGVVNSPDRAAQRTQSTMVDLKHSVDAIVAAQNAQRNARQNISLPNIVNGLQTGGLVVADQTTQPDAVWQNAKQPVQHTNKEGKIEVDIVQTDPKAILSWTQFNVGHDTVVHFDQSAGKQVNGSNNWVALNRIFDQNPSQIFGQVKAEGGVYLLNNYGFIFGAGSVVNTQSFLSSSLDLLDKDIKKSNESFLSQGLNSKTGSGLPVLLNGATYANAEGEELSSWAPNSKLLKARGAIQVEKGASIETGEGGFSFLAAPNLTNAGSISATRGQIVLAAGLEVYNTPILGRENEFGIGLGARSGALINEGLIQNSEGNISLAGKNIAQNGVIGTTTGIRRQGTINLLAESRPSISEAMLEAGRLDLGPHSVTTILPASRTELTSSNNETTTSSEEAKKSVKPAELNLRAGSILLHENALVFAPGASLNANAYTEKDINSFYLRGGMSDNKTLQKQDNTTPNLDFVAGRIWLAPEAGLNVAGTPNVLLSVSDNLLPLPRIGLNELADSPLLRDSFLYRNTKVVVDTQKTGIREDGVDWQGSPVLNIKAYIEQKPQNIDQLQIDGGAINLLGTELIAQKGSHLNLDGGYLHYQAGNALNTTKLQDSDGKVYDIGSADPNFDYVGFAGQHLVTQGGWGLTQRYIDPLLSGQVARFRPAYIQGGNAGQLNLYFTNQIFLNGEISAQAYSGLNQVLSAQQPRGGTLSINDPNMDLMFQLNKNLGTYKWLTPSMVLTEHQSNDLLTRLPDFDATKDLFKGTQLLADRSDQKRWSVVTPKSTINPETGLNEVDFGNPKDRLNPNYWNLLNPTAFKNSGFSALKFYAPEGKILLEKDAQLEVQPGGQIDIVAQQIEVNGQLNATAGKINLATQKGIGMNRPRPKTLFNPTGKEEDKVRVEEEKNDVVVGESAVLNAKGQWVNDKALDQEQLTGSQYIHGGAINITTDASTSSRRKTGNVDTTGSITLAKGSVLDVSSGGYVNSKGQLLTNNGLMQGKGGDISLKTYDKWFVQEETPLPIAIRPDQLPNSGKISIEDDQSLRSFGFSGGGNLNLQALDIQIGEAASNTDHSLWLQPAFFEKQGFGAYRLKAFLNTTLSSGTTIKPSQLNAIPHIDRLLATPTGSDLSSADQLTIGRLDDYQRPATHLSLSAGLLNIGNAKYLDNDRVLQSALTLEKDSAIVADAGAKIELSSTDRMSIEGQVTAPAGQIQLLADTHGQGYRNITSQENYTQSGGTGRANEKDKGIWLGANSRLDVSGTALLNPTALPQLINGGLQPPRTGKLLAGGDIIISNDNGYIAAAPGATLNVSGTQRSFDLLQNTATGTAVLPTEVWSDAGSITLAASQGLYFDGNILAQGGSDKAAGGLLNIMALPTGDEYSIKPAKLVLRQSGELSTLAAVKGSNSLASAPEGVLYFALDRLQDSGIESVNINKDPQQARFSGRDVNSSPYNTTPVYFEGDLKLDLKGNLLLNSPQLIALAPTDAGQNQLSDPAALKTGYQDSADSQVHLNAKYIQLQGESLTKENVVKPIAARANSQFNLDADFIDLLGNINLANFKYTHFNSKGDIRLTAINNNLNTRLGHLYSAGDLNFTAIQLYPVTGSSFALLANANLDGTGKPLLDEQANEILTKISIQSNGKTAKTPLSGGGRLLINANQIEQGGVLRAPAGQLIVGVNNPTDPATQQEFDQLPLTITQQLNLLPGSISSVALDRDMVVPFGKTEDAKVWQIKAGPMVNLAVPPSKRISLAANNVALENGALVDLAGGGKLQAAEWVVGTGGSRDLLSQYNINYVNDVRGNKQATEVPLYTDQRGVYAILPSYSLPVAAYDPYFAVGQAPINVGQQIYLSASADLPAGYYTLLPAKYATLPGAYRVVAQPKRGQLSSQNATLADGTQLISGYWANGLTGARDAISTTFAVQSRQTWGQYSEYVTTSSDAFFAANNVNKANNTKDAKANPALMRDAGQLSLAVNQALRLGATLNTAADKEGVKAQVDIGSAKLQVLGADSSKALDGYLQLKSSELNALDAGSLLLGGTRRQSTDGLHINTLSDHVVVSNDQNTSLEAPEIILVSRPQSNAQQMPQGIQIDAGSVIKSKGDLVASNQDLIFGQAATDKSQAVSGDGSMLRLSNAGSAAVRRFELAQDANGQSTAQGKINIEKNVLLAGGKSLTIDTARRATVDATAQLSADNIALNSGQIALTNDAQQAQGYDGLVIGQDSLKQFSKAAQLTLNSYGDIDFLGNVNLTLDKVLSLGGAKFKGNGGTVDINADQVILSNRLHAQSATPDLSSSDAAININARQITFAEGDQKLSGFARANFNAKELIDVSGRGSFDLGAMPVSISAPVLLANQGADLSLKTQGMLSLKSNGELSKDLQTKRPLGGVVKLSGGSIDSNMQIRAHAGQIELNTTQGDLHLNRGALLDVSGIAKPFFDVNVYAPAGRIKLKAQKGNLEIDQGTNLDFSAPANGGDAGRLELISDQSVNLKGALTGSAQKGKGGSFDLDSGRVVDLNQMAQLLSAGGINESVGIAARQGNLVLDKGQTLSARQVSLTADAGQSPNANEGNVEIYGNIDANAKTPDQAGGKISLSGKSGVTVQGQLLASTQAKDKRGGTVVINTVGKHDGTLNAKYGYQNVQAKDAGRIVLGSQAVIDVSGGSDRGLSGGTVNLRAPLLNDAEVPIAAEQGLSLKGAREVGVNAYAVWSTTDNSTGAQHFDGIIDPAGWFDESGNLLKGNFVDLDGKVIGRSDEQGLSQAKIQDNLNKYSFVPDVANTAHQSFYGYVNADNEAGQAGTLMGFVQNPEFKFESLLKSALGTSMLARPEIELINPDHSLHEGQIVVSSPWNLAAGKYDGKTLSLDYRYHDQAPVLNLRAAKDVQINASLSDGFLEFANPFTAVGFENSTLDQERFKVEQTKEKILANAANNYLPKSYMIFDIPSPAETGFSGDQSLIDQYYGGYASYLDALQTPRTTFFGELSPYVFIGMIKYYGYGEVISNIKAPTPAKSLGDYPDYVKSWKQYYSNISKSFDFDGAPLFEMLAPPPTHLTPFVLITDNSPSPLRVRSNALPMPSATLLGGPSTSFRVLAGADFSSSQPLKLQTASSEGSIRLNGHSEYPATDIDRTMLYPTMLRTGTGSIELAAVANLEMQDQLAPAVIYTAGQPTQGIEASKSIRLEDMNNSLQKITQRILVNGPLNPDAAGDLSIVVGNDILSNEHQMDSDAKMTGTVGTALAQHWWQWMQTANPFIRTNSINAATQSAINFANFAQGIMSVGGDVNISAGRDIRELSVSLPTTWYFDQPDHSHYRTVGGGDLSLNAGRDLLSGQYFVSKGQADIRVGGSIQQSDGLAVLNTDKQASTVLALQDARLNVTVQQNLDIAHIYNPSYLFDFGARSEYVPFGNFASMDLQPLSAASTVNLTSLGGTLNFNTLKYNATSFYSDLGNGGAFNSYHADNVLPATLNMRALQGGISIQDGGVLFPSSTGNLNVIAQDDVQFSFDNYNLYPTKSGAKILVLSDYMDDNNPDQRIPSPINIFKNVADRRTNFEYFPQNSSNGRSYGYLLHAADDQPMRIYSLEGSILNGAELENTGTWYKQMQLLSPKLAQIYAGQDIVNLFFRGQNLHNADSTRIVAGRDILDTNLLQTRPDLGRGPELSIVLGGVGNLDLVAGRHIGPLTSPVSHPVVGFYNADYGVLTTGNRDNIALPRQGANLNVKVGVAPGIQTQAFIARYIAPEADLEALGLSRFDQDLVRFMQQDQVGQKLYTGLQKDQLPEALSYAQAWAGFQKMRPDQQQRFVDQVFNQILIATATDYNDPKSPNFQKYARGYAAINSLFPAEKGYTANNLLGGAQGATNTVHTGDLDIRNTTLQTQQGGNISIMAPGGELVVGSGSAPPADRPSQSGIIAAQQGNVSIFSDRSLLLAQSRIFALQGGNIMGWSSNADINAGKGAKTSSELTPFKYACDIYYFCQVDALSQVTGAGIAAMALPGQTAGTTYLVAPRGTVDAGDAGIRTANIFVAAQQVLNADNIQVSGTSFGVPVAAKVDTGALSAASSAAVAAAQQGTEMGKSSNHRADTLINVEVLGFGADANRESSCIRDTHGQCKVSH